MQQLLRGYLAAALMPKKDPFAIEDITAPDADADEPLWGEMPSDGGGRGYRSWGDLYSRRDNEDDDGVDDENEWEWDYKQAGARKGREDSRLPQPRRSFLDFGQVLLLDVLPRQLEDLQGV
jgi:hypothetical protein